MEGSTAGEKLFQLWMIYSAKVSLCVSSDIYLSDRNASFGEVDTDELSAWHTSFRAQHVAALRQTCYSTVLRGTESVYDSEGGSVYM